MTNLYEVNNGKVVVPLLVLAKKTVTLKDRQYFDSSKVSGEFAQRDSAQVAVIMSICEYHKISIRKKFIEKKNLCNIYGKVSDF